LLELSSEKKTALHRDASGKGLAEEGVFLKLNLAPVFSGEFWEEFASR